MNWKQFLQWQQECFDYLCHLNSPTRLGSQSKFSHKHHHFIFPYRKLHPDPPTRLQKLHLTKTTQINLRSAAASLVKNLRGSPQTNNQERREHEAHLLIAFTVEKCSARNDFHCALSFRILFSCWNWSKRLHNKWNLSHHRSVWNPLLTGFVGDSCCCRRRAFLRERKILSDGGWN